MNKPSQFVFLPTEKATEIYKIENKLFYAPNNKIPIHIRDGYNLNLYILSDDEIKEGDWFLFMRKEVIKALNKINVHSNETHYRIIATTNPELLKEKRIDEGFVEISSVAKISQSDIEYIISLYNGKSKEVDVDELAFKECGNDHYGKEKYRDGYKRCLQDNADKKFTLEDMRIAMTMAKENTLSMKEIIQSISKEQPKRDTVMVEYQQVEQDGVLPYDKSIPKLKDGNIVIVR